MENGYTVLKINNKLSATKIRNVQIVSLRKIYSFRIIKNVVALIFLGV